MKRLVFLGVLAGCAPVPESPPPSAPTRPDTCGIASHQNLIGLSHSDLLRIEILGPVRVIRPGRAVTMDFRADRLNIMLNEGEIVTAVSCG